jgi:hypothetical protein
LRLSRSISHVAAATAALALFAPANLAHGSMPDAAVQQRMIRESLASYPGNCPCPYNVARNGSSCGRRSAWSRAGGYAPLCYVSDIPKAQVQAYRMAHGL